MKIYWKIHDGLVGPLARLERNRVRYASSILCAFRLLLPIHGESFGLAPVIGIMNRPLPAERSPSPPREMSAPRLVHYGLRLTEYDLLLTTYELRITTYELRITNYASRITHHAYLLLRSNPPVSICHRLPSTPSDSQKFPGIPDFSCVSQLFLATGLAGPPGFSMHAQKPSNALAMNLRLPTPPSTASHALRITNHALRIYSLGTTSCHRSPAIV